MTDHAQPKTDQPETDEALASIDEIAAPTPKISLADGTLDGLFDQARAALLRHGELHETPRGPTRSLNGVVLTWVAPERDTTAPPRWTRAEIEWYLDVFVKGRSENDPLRPAAPGSLVFPYTYAARARFWDGGWGYLRALTEAMRTAGHTIESISTSRAAFEDFLARMGERLHLQTVLALCKLYPHEVMRRWLVEPELLDAMLRSWRQDLLAHAIADVRATPESRRAIVSSLIYPQLDDQLRPRMGIPPYQLFQYLPGEEGSPLSSIHVHRSLDLDGGAPLDFYHDLAWLREASVLTRRPVGDITVVAHNLHSYVRPEGTAGGDREGIREWLCRVTDGYKTGEGTPRELMAQRAYAVNAEGAWERWRP